MNIVIVLKNALLALNQMHVLGAETALFEGAKGNLLSAIRALEKAEEEAKRHADHDEQRKHV